LKYFGCKSWLRWYQSRHNISRDRHIYISYSRKLQVHRWVPSSVLIVEPDRESRSNESKVEMRDAHTEGPSQKYNFFLFRKESRMKYDLTNILPFIDHWPCLLNIISQI